MKRWQMAICIIGGIIVIGVIISGLTSYDREYTPIKKGVVIPEITVTLTSTHSVIISGVVTNPYDYALKNVNVEIEGYDVNGQRLDHHLDRHNLPAFEQISPHTSILWELSYHLYNPFFYGSAKPSGPEYGEWLRKLDEEGPYHIVNITGYGYSSELKAHLEENITKVPKKYTLENIGGKKDIYIG